MQACVEHVVFFPVQQWRPYTITPFSSLFILHCFAISFMMQTIGKRWYIQSYKVVFTCFQKFTYLSFRNDSCNASLTVHSISLPTSIPFPNILFLLTSSWASLRFFLWVMLFFSLHGWRSHADHCSHRSIPLMAPSSSLVSSIFCRKAVLLISLVVAGFQAKGANERCGRQAKKFATLSECAKVYETL